MFPDVTPPSTSTAETPVKVPEPVTEHSEHLPVKILVAVPSQKTPTDSDARKTVRQTWAGYPEFRDNTCILRFFCELPIPGEDDVVVLDTFGKSRDVTINVPPHDKFKGSTQWVDFNMAMIRWALANVPNLTHYLRMDGDAFFCPRALVGILASPSHPINHRRKTRVGMGLSSTHCNSCGCDEAFNLISVELCQRLVQVYPDAHRKYSSNFRRTFAANLHLLLRFAGLRSGDGGNIEWWWQNSPKPAIFFPINPADVPKTVQSLKLHQEDPCRNFIWVHPAKRNEDIKTLFALSQSGKAGCLKSTPGCYKATAQH